MYLYVIVSRPSDCGWIVTWWAKIGSDGNWATKSKNERNRKSDSIRSFFLIFSIGRWCRIWCRFFCSRGFIGWRQWNTNKKIIIWWRHYYDSSEYNTMTSSHSVESMVTSSNDDFIKFNNYIFHDRTKSSIWAWLVPLSSLSYYDSSSMTSLLSY